jgi:hypothetical protein
VAEHNLDFGHNILNKARILAKEIHMYVLADMGSDRNQAATWGHEL